MTKEEILNQLNEKLSIIGDIELNLTEEYQRLIDLQNKMLKDIKEKSFPMGAYLSYFDNKLVKKSFQELKEKVRLENIFMKIISLTIVVGCFGVLPEVLWGMLVVLAIFLIYLRNQDLQSENYRNLCQKEVARLCTECKNIENKLEQCKKLEASIKKAIEQVHITAMTSMSPTIQKAQFESIMQEYAPKLVFAYPKDEKC